MSLLSLTMHSQWVLGERLCAGEQRFGSGQGAPRIPRFSSQSLSARSARSMCLDGDAMISNPAGIVAE